MANGRSVSLRFENGLLRGPKLRHIRLQRYGCPSSSSHRGLESQPGRDDHKSSPNSHRNLAGEEKQPHKTIH